MAYMCGRYTLTVNQKVLKERFFAEPPKEYVPRFNAAPAQKLPVILNSNPKEIELVRWGIKPVWFARKDGLINVRMETLLQKKTFQKDFQERRCLVLADGFYEWQQTKKGKQPYRFVLKDREPFAFAGIWETNLIDGEKVTTFTIITTTPNNVAASVHNRMPVILAPDEEERWLNEPVADFLDPYPDSKMEAYKVKTTVNRPSLDTAALIEPLEELNSA